MYNIGAETIARFEDYMCQLHNRIKAESRPPVEYEIDIVTYTKEMIFWSFARNNKLLYNLIVYQVG